MWASQRLMFTLLVIIMGVGVELTQLVDATWPVDINIINNLESGKILQVHCKDKNNDYGVHKIQPNQTYGFHIDANFVSNYFCGFVFDNVLHWFDVYIDINYYSLCGKHGHCDWYVKEAGPCGGGPDLSQCFPWNQN